MNGNSSLIWGIVTGLVISSWIIASRCANLAKEIQTLEVRVAAVERTDDWFNTVYTNTIAVTCDYMRHQESKQWAAKISEAFEASIEAGYPTNTLSGSFGGYRYVNGLMIGVETNEVNP